MIIGLASPRIASSLEEGVKNVQRLIAEASTKGAEIVCFPEAYLPGLRGLDFEVPTFDQNDHDRALREVAEFSRKSAIASIIGMEKPTAVGKQIVSYVIDAQGEIQGYQSKNQLDPTENKNYVPGNRRSIFEINDVKFGIAICHEGFRYPETVRWAAMRGAKIVFHPHFTGSDQKGITLKQFGDPAAPYYEKAMIMRSIENTIYFASVTCATKFHESATALIDPSGNCQAYLPYGQEGVLIQTIDPQKATGLIALRFAPDRYLEEATKEKRLNTDTD